MRQSIHSLQLRAPPSTLHPTVQAPLAGCASAVGTSSLTFPTMRRASRRRNYIKTKHGNVSPRSPTPQPTHLLPTEKRTPKYDGPCALVTGHPQD